MPQRSHGRHAQHREQFFTNPKVRPMGVGLQATSGAIDISAVLGRARIHRGTVDITGTHLAWRVPFDTTHP
ncbi:hypothetical protein [Actinophytocola sp. NPDC049390]|uniref:hypothetical protein n=1 Tax=Actinophytocola sp. NPDC049390 TaxID=3363894 RepID=UPI0037B2F243